MDKDLISVTMGKNKADYVIKNGKVVNVYSKEIYLSDVAIYKDKIAAVGDVDYCIGEETTVIDAADKYLLPGFIDGHIHPESANLTMSKFAEIMLVHGTTSIMPDMHEVGVVGGLKAMEAVLKEGEDTPLKVYFVAPSHVPFCIGLETSGGVVNSDTVAQMLKREDTVGLSEIVAPYFLGGAPELLKSMELTLQANKGLHGHLPEVKGKEMQACIAAGICSDHESLTIEDALERVRMGCHLMMRESSVAHNLVDCLKVITENNVDSTMCSIVTDDLHTVDAVEKGHLDNSLRIALENGVDFPTAVQMVTLNAARAFNLDKKIGSIIPGRFADINITTGPEDFKVERVFASGKLVAENGKLINKIPTAKHETFLFDTVKLQKKITAEDLAIKVDDCCKNVKAKVMRTLPWIPITTGEEKVLPVAQGIVQADVKQDVLYIAEIERYGKNGNIGKAFMAGFNLKSGAIASTIAHDNHNIIVLGTNLDDMAFAANRLAEIGGGQIIVENSEVIHEISYPVLGLLSDLDAWTLADEKKKLIYEACKRGCSIGYPYMFLSFISLSAIPEYAITDYGFIDVFSQRVISPILEELE